MIPPRLRLAPVVFGVIVLAVGVLLLWQGWQVPGDLGPRGPRFLPVILAVGWVYSRRPIWPARSPRWQADASTALQNGSTTCRGWSRYWSQ